MCLCVPGGCDRGQNQPDASRPVIVYCSVDEDIARPILMRYQQQTGLAVEAVFDSEAGKTTGLVQRLIAETQSGRVRADVFWSSEIFNTVALAKLNVLESYEPKAADDIPARFVDTGHRWTGLAVRARVLAFDPKRTSAAEVPNQWHDLGRPEFAQRTAIANPLFGTTRGHLAAMFAIDGESKGRAFLEAMRKEGAMVVDGNSASVRALIAGHVDFAATDSDDVWLAQRAGESVDTVYPTLGGKGTLLIPCSVALVRGGPNEGSARKLIDFLVSAETERLLAESAARFIPVRERLRDALGLEWPAEFVVDYNAVAEALPASEAAVREILIR
jgi:iron(III) transport system substrate-binding protein